MRNYHSQKEAGAASGMGKSAEYEAQLRAQMAGQMLDGLRLLVADDEQDARRLIALMLERYGALVWTVESAAAAVAALEEPPDNRPFDLLLSDIGMPEEDGYELIGRVRRHSDRRVCAIKAVALTAYARPEDRFRALKAGYQMHIPKPVEEDELITIVASLTGRLDVSKPTEV